MYKLQQYFSPLLDKLLLLGTFGIAFVYALKRISDSDHFHHIKSGEYLFEYGEILTTYYFNCTQSDAPLLNHEWLYQAIIYLIDSAAGEPGLVIFQVMLILASFVFLYHIIRINSNNIPVIVFVLILGILASMHRFALRPQHLSYLFLLYTIFSLYHYQRGVHRYAYFLPLIMLAWVNVHAECLWGLVVPGGFWLVEFFKRLNGYGLDGAALKKLVIIIILIVAASMINPFSYQTIIWPLIVMKDMSGGVDELTAPTSIRFLFFWIYCAVYYIAVISLFRKVDITWLILSIGYLIIAWTANRAIPHFVFISAPLVTLGLEYLLLIIPTHFRSIDIVSNSIKLLLLGIVFSVIILVISSPAYFNKYDNIPYPEKAISFLKEVGVKGNVFNEHLWGGFLIANGYPELRPYIDGRHYRKQFFDGYIAILGGSPGWEVPLAQSDVTIVMIRHSEIDQFRLSDALFNSPDWQLVYFDDIALVYLKMVDGNADVINKYAITDINPDRQLTYIYPDLPGLAMKSNVAFERNLAFAAPSYRASIMSANSFTSIANHALACVRYREALENLEPLNAWIFFRLAVCNRETGNLKTAQEYLQKTLELAPEYERARNMMDSINALSADP